MTRRVVEHHAELDGEPVAWRSAPAPDPDRAPVLYVHGVPTSSALWEPFLERTGGLALDLCGFGASSKRGDLPYTIDGLSDWVRRFLDLVEEDRVRLVVHDWGASALGWAQAEPERVERLVVVDAVPLLGGFEWHRAARIWRTRGLGEAAMGVTGRLVLRRALPPQLVDLVTEGFDQGTQRAILHLYRWADPECLEAAGRGLRDIAAPALVVWGSEDPYIPARFAHGYAAGLGDATAEIVEGAGHWPWLDAPDLVRRITDFVDGR